ncbi:MAG: phosphoribosyl-ATP diphosphatase [Victivallales bacterium]|nr:phosphoribosyl-ATP diphosphatase [Victivallales bacterium]
MKRFEELFAELKQKAAAGDPNSGTVKMLQKGRHAIGKKVVEEAGEVWMAAEYEGREKTAEEISQLLYHLQTMMIACELELDDVYKYL